MAQLGIPEEYRVGFTVLRSLKNDQVQQLVSALNEVQPVRSRRGLHASVASKVEGIEYADLSEALDALTSLFGLREDMSTSTLELVEVISDAIDQSGFGDLGFSGEEDRRSFENLLTRILEIESFELAAKAISLVYEQDHIVHGTPRVLTDMRPIFSSDPAEMSVHGAMVTYTLRIEYHERARIQELFLALNAEQVDELITTLERARSKAEKLKQFLQESPIRYVEAE